MILIADLNRSVEQKVACVLIRRMSKCYPMKSILSLNVLHSVNKFGCLLFAYIRCSFTFKLYNRIIKSETRLKSICQEFTYTVFTLLIIETIDFAELRVN